MRTLVAFVTCMLSLVPAAASAADLPPPSDPAAEAVADEWRFVIAAYMWGAGLSGTSSVGNLPPIDIGMSFSDILSDLDFAGFTAAEVSYRRFVGFTDLYYVKISAEQSTPFNILATQLKLRSESLSWMFAGGYRVIDEPRIEIDALAGGRLYSLSNRLSVSGASSDRRRASRPRRGSIRSSD